MEEAETLRVHLETIDYHIHSILRDTPGTSLVLYSDCSTKGVYSRKGRKSSNIYQNLEIDPAGLLQALQYLPGLWSMGIQQASLI